MKKIFPILASIFLFLMSNPILAQLADPGDDPEAVAAPIDGYVWVLAVVGITFIFLKVRACNKQSYLSSKGA
jgi:hypothetical protein